jgi:hypothetical protein
MRRDVGKAVSGTSYNTQVVSSIRATLEILCPKCNDQGISLVRHVLQCRRCSLCASPSPLSETRACDVRIGAEGATRLADALRTNTTLRALDLTGPPLPFMRTSNILSSGLLVNPSSVMHCVIFFHECLDAWVLPLYTLTLRDNPSVSCVASPYVYLCVHVRAYK